MKKIACIALLTAVSLQAQNAPAPPQATPPQRESAPQNQAQPPGGVVERELPVGDEIRKTLDLGYNFDVRQVKFRTFTPTPCAIPLMPIPVPDKNLAIRNSPANPSIDSRIVLAPLVPACPQTVAPVVIKPLEADADKKADKK